MDNSRQRERERIRKRISTLYDKKKKINSTIDREILLLKKKELKLKEKELNEMSFLNSYDNFNMGGF